MKPERDRGTRAVAPLRTMPPTVAAPVIGFSSIVVVLPFVAPATSPHTSSPKW